MVSKEFAVLDFYIILHIFIVNDSISLSKRTCQKSLFVLPLSNIVQGKLEVLCFVFFIIYLR